MVLENYALVILRSKNNTSKRHGVGESVASGNQTRSHWAKAGKPRPDKMKLGSNRRNQFQDCKGASRSMEFPLSRLSSLLDSSAREAAAVLPGNRVQRMKCKSETELLGQQRRPLTCDTDPQELGSATSVFSSQNNVDWVRDVKYAVNTELPLLNQSWFHEYNDECLDQLKNAEHMLKIKAKRLKGAFLVRRCHCEPEDNTPNKPPRLCQDLILSVGESTEVVHIKFKRMMMKDTESMINEGAKIPETLYKLEDDADESALTMAKHISYYSSNKLIINNWKVIELAEPIPRLQYDLI